MKDNINELSFLTEKQMSELTGYSRSFFQRARWCGHPKIPYLKLPGQSKILYPVNEVKEFFAQYQLKTSTSQHSEVK